MGCGSSSQVVPSEEGDGQNAHKMGNGNGGNHAMGNGKDMDDDGDDLSTLVLPESPVTKKPPIAFEIPLEDGDPRKPRSPPPHLQRLMNPVQPDISRTDIEDKLAEAEIRRQMILQQRAASAQRRSQKMMKSLHDMETIEIPDPDMEMPSESMEKVKLPGTNMHIPNERTERKNIK